MITAAVAITSFLSGWALSAHHERRRPVWHPIRMPRANEDPATIPTYLAIPAHTTKRPWCALNIGGR